MTIKPKQNPLNDLDFDTRATYVIEQLIAHILIPLAMVLLLLRSRKEPAHLQNLLHRMGFGPVGPKKSIWVFAASLGETRAASPLILRLRSEGFNIVLTHQSPAGFNEGTRLFSEDIGVTQCYVPLDLFWTIRIFLNRSKPLALIIMEIEIWPAMIIETACKGIPVIMANGNLLEKSISKKNYIRRKINNIYQVFSHIFTRDNSYFNRYVKIGVNPLQLSVVGELKFDQLIDPAHLLLGERLRRQIKGAKRVLMIASSVEAEEHILLPMVARLLAADPGLRIVWAPRSPQRFKAVADALSLMGINVAQRSALGAQPETFNLKTQVLVGDSIGEMNAYYILADLVFVGASLVDHGGHNIVEPMVLGRPVIMGPSTYGIDFSAVPAGIAGAFESLENSTALEARIVTLLKKPDTLKKMATAAKGFAAGKTGAAVKTCNGIKDLLYPTTQSK